MKSASRARGFAAPRIDSDDAGHNGSALRNPDETLRRPENARCLRDDRADALRHRRARPGADSQRGSRTRERRRVLLNISFTIKDVTWLFIKARAVASSLHASIRARASSHASLHH